MARVVEYVFLFPVGDIQLRHRHVQDRGRVLSFVVQLELWWRSGWQPITRYDTAHGFAHRDLIHPDGRVDKTTMGLEDWNQALDTALEDLKANWSWYRQRFMEEAKRHD